MANAEPRLGTRMVKAALRLRVMIIVDAAPRLGMKMVYAVPRLRTRMVHAVGD